jgi:signal transduction histidine kinase
VFLQPQGGLDEPETWRTKLQRTAEIIADGLSCQACSIFLVDPRSPKRLVLQATTSEALRSKIGMAEYREGEGLTGGVALLLAPLRLSEVGNPEELKSDYPEFWRRGVRWHCKYGEYDQVSRIGLEFLGVPILWRENPQSRGELMGVIRCVGKISVEHFSEEDEHLLVTIADWIAVGLKHAEMVGREQEQHKWREYSDHLLRHQLQSPLTTVWRLLEILEESVPAQQIRTVQDCRTRLNQMLRLMESLRILSQVGDLRSLKMELILLYPLVGRVKQQAIDDFLVEYPDRKPAEIGIAFSDLDLSVNGYRVFLREALLNLLNNALKVRLEGQRVTVQVATRPGIEAPPPGTFVVRDGQPQEMATWLEALPDPGLSEQPVRDMVTIAVTDQGPGLAQEMFAPIFEPMISFPAGQGQKGSGLGLTLVQETMRAHEGAVAVRSRPGEGATFTLIFPKEVGSAAQDSAH